MSVLIIEDRVMNKDWAAFVCVGIIIGAVLIGILANNVGIIPEHKDAKELCEQSLPRDKQCVMYFKAED